MTPDATPERDTAAPTRALQWAHALDLLLEQIHALPHEPDIAHELLVLWERFERLRRDDTSS